MNIFLDESGSFASAAKENSWNAIAAYMSPEFERRRLDEILTHLKHRSGAPRKRELKLRNVQEDAYFSFLRSLAKLDGALFSVATDAGVGDDNIICEHKGHQADKIAENKNRMLHESGRRWVQTLSDQVRSLAPQLYVQLQCQMLLVCNVIKYGTLYFVQRCPRALGDFRWRIDQKNATQTEFEKAFLAMTPGILQTIFLRDPLPMLKDADYTAFSRFEYPDGEAPTYLETDYGIEEIGDSPGLNIGQIIQEDIEFADSKNSFGIQVADLLASGLRRVLRRQFKNNHQAAALLGGLMPQREKGSPPVQLLGFSGKLYYISDEITHVVRMMERYNRPIIVN